MRRLDSLAVGLEKHAIDGFRWRIDVEQDWPFFLAPVETRPALMDLFRDYPFPSAESVSGWSEIESHYARVSRALGFEVEPPNLVLTRAGHALVDRGEEAAALEVLNHLVEIYPHSLDGPWQLANLYRAMGDTTAAIRYYEECLRRDPSMVPARTWLDRLRGNRSAPPP
jgi:tetratricopeptide (TPR) repeat protein